MFTWADYSRHPLSLSLELRSSERLHLVAERGVPVNQPQDVAVDAAARGKLGEDG